MSTYLPNKSHNFILILFLVFQFLCADTEPSEKETFCSTLVCVNETKNVVCGIRAEREGFRFKLFENECELLKYGCNVSDKLTYGIINEEYCMKSFSNPKDKENLHVLESCEDIDCVVHNSTPRVCGFRQDGEGFRIKLFLNKCQLLKYNCNENLNFNVTDLYLCNELAVTEIDDKRRSVSKIADKQKHVKIKKSSNLVVVDGALINFNGNVNESIENFFEATHYLNVPLVEMNNISLDEQTRRHMRMKNAGPVKVFEPWIKVPKNKTMYSENPETRPTIASCYHKCPKKCPDHYAPVCGVPGVVAREPSIMFQNHCYMDVAQCKMKRENKSSTADSSDYIESSFVFCLGDTMMVLYRFLPLVRTLQHMGRLRKRGKFKYKLQNMRFLNNYLMREPNLMG